MCGSSTSVSHTSPATDSMLPPHVLRQLRQIMSDVTVDRTRPFPPPGDSGPEGLVLQRFVLLGRAAAKALQDSRLLDVPLSYVFYKCAAPFPLGQF